jgi:hypothetical protein
LIDAEDEELESADVPDHSWVVRWNWLLYGTSIVNLGRNVLVDVASHLDDIVYMLAEEAHHRAHRTSFADDVRLDLESIPTTKE